MTNVGDPDDQAREVLGNGQVMAFVAHQWTRRPRWSKRVRAWLGESAATNSAHARLHAVAEGAA
jgi:hypothetical protein